MYLSVYIWSMAWICTTTVELIITTDTLWPTKPKISVIWPFTEAGNQHTRLCRLHQTWSHYLLRFGTVPGT